MQNQPSLSIISTFRTMQSGNYKLFARDLKRKLFFLNFICAVMMFNNTAIAQYCSSNPSCGNAYISTLDFNGSTNSSGAGGYTLYASPTFTISPLQVCTITINGSIAFAGNYHLNAWIDFDGSGDWNGVNSELIAIPTVSYPLGAFTKSVTFTVPATATVGNSRLRVQLRYVGPVFGAPNPCLNSFCGEVEDYPVVIAPLPPLCSSSSNNSSGIYISRTDINGTTTFSGPSTYSSYLPGITLFPQTNYTLSVDVTNPTATAQSVYIYGWLEVNGDNVFSQNPNEQIVVTPVAVNIPAFTTQSFSKVFYYNPPYAIQASTLRVTASLASNGVPTPCATSFTGEVEDYSVVMHSDYCTDAGTSNSEYITNVTLNGVSNPSGPGLYSDFTSVVIPLFPGQSFPVTVNTGGAPTLTSVYIDFNQNGYFQDPGEQINLSSGAGGFAGNIPVPAGATVGNTRMRVVTLFTVGGGNALPCFLNGVSGEVEDYTVMIISPNPPVISCGADIVVSQQPGQCYKQVLYSLPTCTANCNGGVITLTSGLPSGSNFPVGTTPVTYKVTTPGGVASCTFYVTVNLNPLPVFSPSGTQIICQGNSANLSINNGTSYLWSTGATTSGITTSTGGNYTVTVTGSSGCTQAFNQTVVVNPAPTPVISGNLPFCSGSSTTLDAGSGYAGYNWSSGETTQAITVNSLGTFTVTVTNASGCTGSASVATTLNANPVPSISGNTSFCAGNSTTLDAGSGYAGYSWSNGGTTQTITVSSVGTFTVTVTNASGCTGSASVATSLSANLTPSISGNTSICAGGSTTLDAGSGYVGYNWSGGETTQTITVNSVGTFTVTVTNASGCTGSASVATSLSTNLTPSISGSTSFCAGSLTTLDAGSGYAGYSWSNGGTTQTITVSSAGTFTVTVTNASGCTGSASVATTLSTNPTPSISGNTSICSGSSTMLDAGPGYSNYNWAGGETTQTISANTAGTYTVTVTNVGGCTGSASVAVSVISAPPNINVAFPVVPAYACNGNNLIATTSVVANATTYTWDGPAGTTFNSAGNPYSSANSSVTVNYGPTNGSGYNICVQAGNACGTTNRRCSFVRGTVNTPGVITPANGRTVECPNTSANYNIAAIGGATSYTWSITGNATVIGSGTSATVSFGSAWTGGNLCVTANTPCFNSTPRCLALSNATNLPGAISGLVTACPGSSGVYSVPVEAGAATYNWILPPNSTGNSTTNSILVNFLSGFTQGDIKISITSICGVTTAKKTKTISNGLPLVPASITGNTSGLCGQSVTYNCPSVAGANSYTWAASAGTINSGQGSTSVNISFGSVTNGNVCVTAGNACGASSPRCIPVKGSPTVAGDITYTPGTICANQSGIDFEVNPVFGATSYNWGFPTGVQVVLDLGNEQLVNWGNTGGVVTVTATNACGSSTKTTIVSLLCREIAPVVVNEENSITVYPNPAYDKINVQFTAVKKANYVLNILDLSGRTINTLDATAQKGLNTNQVDLSNLAKGVYVVELKSDLLNKQIRIVVE